MSDRYKYANNGIYKCANFAQHARTNSFQTFTFHRKGDSYIWRLKFNIENIYDLSFACLGLSSTSPSEYRLRTFFNVLRKDGSSGSMRRENNCTWRFRTNGPVKKYFDLSELLKLENEYLDDDGSLSIEYGIQVDAIAVWHKIWQFNFKNTVFNYTGEEKQVVRCVHNIGSSPKRFFFSAEILNFHCPQYVEQAAKLVAEPGGMWTTDVDECLQILHGVQVPLLALNGIYTCDNFAEHVAANNFPEHHLGTVGGIDDWTKEANLILETNMGPRGVSLNVLEVLNTKNEFLDDGALSVEYGLHLFSYEGDDGIWKFNFDDQFYNTNEMSVVKFTNHLNDYEYYCSKEILMFHCPKLAKNLMIKSYLDLTSFDDFLQIIHGVQIQYKDDHFSVLRLAQFFNVPNVLSYFDRPYVDEEITFEMAAKFKLKHILCKKLKELKREKVTRRLSKLDIAKLTGETMKAFVAKVLYEKF